MLSKAILVVSFGTSHEDTRAKTIDAIERDMAVAYPELSIYRAFTSKKIISILAKRDGIKVNTVAEAMMVMKADGIKEVIVQPTHILNGIENELMIKEVSRHDHEFVSVKIGAPLLTRTQDYWDVIDAFSTSLPKMDVDQACLCMGHGTEHHTNATYAALDYMFKAKGHENIHVACVEGYPELDDLMDTLHKKGYKKLILKPFMIVAGDHAKNDMAGDEEDSWKQILEKEGFEVTCIMEGLGELSGIRDILVSHVV